MRVLKRNNSFADMKFDKVTARISNLTNGLSQNISADKVAQKVFSSMYDGIKTQEIDSLSAEVSIGMITEDPDYEILSTRIVSSNIQKICPSTFTQAMAMLNNIGLLAEDVWEFVNNNQEQLNKMIKKNRDSDFGFFGLKTLEKGYLQRVNGVLVETPQYLFLRVSIGIHCGDLKKIQETYDYMSQGYFIHATPTLFNSGTKRPQMSSCFLVAMKDDSIDGIYDTVKECAQISKWAGGIGLHVHNVRANKSIIKGTNGVSDGIIPMLRVFNSTARYVNQAGRRKGSIAVYIEPWHADIMEFLELRLNQGDEEARCRDLFLGLWTPDLFMKRVEEGGEWSLFSPDEAPGLSDSYGQEFEKLYLQYESEGRARATLPASKVWMAILKSQTETGTPYMLYKDACNNKSNQKNLGVIKSSNLCTEIIEFTDKDETAVCNLASLALPRFVDKDGEFNYNTLYKAVRTLTRNLNKVIDRNFYPTESGKNSNTRHRPIGLGVQGLADVFAKLNIPFESEEAHKINNTIFETIYHAAVTESVTMAKESGPYETFQGSPASQGLLQFDMWDGDTQFSGMWNWSKLKQDVKKFGMKNSLLVAPMPTASTSQILGNNECFEPYTTNIYLRRTLAGEFVVVNKHLVSKLKELGLWSKEMKDKMIANSGSVQDIPEIPDQVKQVYKTVWEISQRSIIDMAADRARFIDQSQSMNLFVENPTVSKLSSMHMYAWKKGLKTGMYYLRTKAKSKAIQFTLEPCKSCSA
jgi:ribonucleoside-diphosphate reductase alpha chain/ribonucleoside-diphosphate reductase subunit M1